MKSSSLAAACAVVGVGASFACAPALDEFQSSYLMTVESPAADAPIEFCAQLLVNQVDPVTFQPTENDKAPPPTNIAAFMTVENEDVYTLSPTFDARLFGPAMVFDIGPIGAFYETSAASFTTTDDFSNPAPASPANVTITRTLVEGRVVSATELLITYDYSFSEDELKRGSTESACDVVRITWRAKGSG